MKIRKGFVSNSSSSSFVCDVCNHDESGWDMCLEDVGMVGCENGHVFCEEHLIEEIPEDIDDYDVPEKYCPVCSFSEITDGDISLYLKQKYRITDEEIKKELKERFSSYKDFINNIKREGR